MLDIIEAHYDVAEYDAWLMDTGAGNDLILADMFYHMLIVAEHQYAD